MKQVIILLAATTALIIGLLLFSPWSEGEIRSDVISLPYMPGDFRRADGPRNFEFPADHGPHNDFQTEWWYYTGNLVSKDGRQFGYQLTFFRRALLPEGERIERSSEWGVEQVYMAHFTLTDVQENEFYYWERLTRGEAALSGSSGMPWFEVWLYDWQVKQIAENVYELHAAQEGIALSLLLEDIKGPVLQGEDGYSAKGPQTGNASYYYSQTRLLASGSIIIADESIPVSGTSWMDHEFSTSALSEGQVGWDWFSIQLDGDREIMVYTIRREDGTVDPYSTGALIAQDGTTKRLEADDFDIEVNERWISPQTGTTYPAGWMIRIPAEEIFLSAAPLISDQELSVSFVYWEGAVEVTGSWGGEPVSGKGYVELTGYAESMAGQF